MNGSAAVLAACDHITRNGLVRPGDRIALAYSGGVDSTAALIVLSRHFDSALVVAVHVDHRLDPGSRERAEHAARNAARLGVATIVVDAVVDADPRGPEAAARAARFAALARISADLDLDAVAVAHTTDDRAETVLLALLRGTGLDGLAAMGPEGPLPHHPGPQDPRNGGPAVRLIRPVLGLRREETRAICRWAGLTPVEDPANDDPRFLRNRVRAQVMPSLEELRTGAADRIARTAELLAQDRAALDFAASRLVDVVVEAAPGYVAFEIEALDAGVSGPTRALVARIVRREIGRLLGGSPPRRDALDAVFDGCGGTLPGTRLRARDEGPVRVVAAAVQPCSPVLLEIPGTTRLGDLSIRAGPGLDEGVSWVVRRIEEGDRRSGASRSLHDEMARAGVVRRLRERAAVLLRGGVDGEIVAALVPGRPVGPTALDVAAEWWWDSGA